MTHQEYKIENKPVFSLIAEEDKVILEAKNKRFDIRRQGLYPSESSVSYIDGTRKVSLGKCLRAAWYRATGIEKTNPGGINLYQTGRIGKEAEIMQIRLWKEMGIWEANNIKFFNKDLALSGEMDAILKNPITNGLMGIEMKTYYGYPATRSICGIKKERGSGKFLAGRPKDDHFLQACLYAWEYKDKLDEYRIFYFDRGDGTRVEFRVGFAKRNDGNHQCYWEQIPGKYWNAYQEGRLLQPYTIEDIHLRYQNLIEFLRKKTMPPKDYEEVWNADMIEFKYSQGEISKTNYDKWLKKPDTNKIGDWHCSYCDYKDQCKLDEATA